MNEIQIFFNSFIVVVLMIRYAEQIFDHPARSRWMLYSFLGIAGCNTVLLSKHYDLAESLIRAGAIGAMFLILGVAFAKIKRCF